MTRERFDVFDRLDPAVRKALTETVFEMSALDFVDMPPAGAVAYIRDIDRAVRIADSHEKRR